MFELLRTLARARWARKAGNALSPLLLATVVALGGALPTHTLHAQDLPTAVDVPLNSGFTYQGRLDAAGVPINATCAMQFDLWNALAGGGQVGATQSLNSVAVTQGLFTVTLNEASQFGAAAFAGDARFLEMAVQCPGDAAFVTLPRQSLTATPYALTSLSANALRGQPVSAAAPAPGNVLTWNGSLWAGAAPIATDWSGITGIPAGFADNVDNEGWKLDANSDATAASRLGTTAAVTMTIVVSNTPVARLAPGLVGSNFAPSMIFGSPFNQVLDGAAAASIGGGGGSPSDANQVADNFGTVAGGRDNRAGSSDANPTNGTDAVVGGGYGNVASGTQATISGGRANFATAEYATVGGGRINQATGAHSTVAGGEGALASLRGQFAYASGGFADNTGIQDIGSAQFSVFVLRNVNPSGAVNTELFLNGQNQRLVLRNNSAMTFEAIVTARGDATPGVSGGWRIRGVIENSGGVITIFSPTTEFLGGDAGNGFVASNVTAEADDTNNSLRIVVDNTTASEQLRWVAVVRVTEAVWD